MRIEFVPPPALGRLDRSAMAISALLLVAAVAGQGIATYRRQAADTAARQALLDGDGRRGLAASQPVIEPAWTPAMRDALRRSALPEATALRQLEGVLVPGLHVESLEIDGIQTRVAAEVSAESDAALEDYVDQLNQGESAPAWRLERVVQSAATATAANTANVVAPRVARLLWTDGKR